MPEGHAKLEMVEVLRAEPDLAAGIPEPRRSEAEKRCVAAVTQVRRGRWVPPGLGEEPAAAFGLLVLDGFLVRRAGHDERWSAELLGPGDLLRPWSEIQDQGGLDLEHVWDVISRIRFAVLGPQFAYRAAPYPEIASNLVSRALSRSRQREVESVIARERPVEARIELLLAHLAERWGRVCPDGIRLDVPLTHSLIAELVAARRPTITSGLGTLAAAGRVVRSDNGCWLIPSRNGVPSMNGNRPAPSVTASPV